MDLPKQPDDPDLKNIIDKLANFVARNGREFEQMTKQKQKENPKFQFLFGGQHFNYYQYKVTTEQAIMNQQKQKMAQGMAGGMAMQSIPPPGIANIPCSAWQANPAQIQITQQLKEQLDQLRTTTLEQIKQSESNLSAQYQSLMHQRTIQIEESMNTTDDKELNKLYIDCEVKPDELDSLLQVIIDSCTKDAISAGKNWIFSHCSSENHARLIALVLKAKIIDKDALFTQRLHLIYLINDVLHHCVRKNAGQLKISLEKVVTPVFCYAHAAADVDKRAKLVKLLTLWEQNKYFDTTVTTELKDPVQAMKKFRDALLEKNPSLAEQVTSAVTSRFSSLQQQHNDFVTHLNSQVQALEVQMQQSMQPPVPDPVTIPSITNPANIPPPQIVTSLSLTTAPPTSTTQQLPHGGPPPNFPPPDFSKPPPNFSQPPPGFPPPPAQFEYGHGQGPPAPIVQEYNHGQGAPPTSGSPALMSLGLPDLSRPPPGFPPPGAPPSNMPSLNDADLMPSVPYFELPAGLMAPLVKLEDSSYRPLDPKQIRLPPPMPPNERLLAAVEAFYSAPSHERPRDSEGWEKLGLFEFFKAKEKAKKLKEQEGRKSRSRSRSGSISGSKSRSQSRSRSRSKSPKEKRSGSASPPYQRTSRSHSKSKSRSRSCSRTPSPNAISRAPDHLLPQELSPDLGEPFYTTNTNTRLGNDNKGFNLLKKMGWGGGGLGLGEHGIVDPVEAGDVREKMDMFKGLGIGTAGDPFEAFRKNKSAGFISRMKERDPNKP